MPTLNETLNSRPGQVAAGAMLGTAAVAANLNPVHLHRAGLAGPANNFVYAFADALKHHAKITTALGAGGTALIGGPIVVAAGVAAAPWIAAAGVVAVTGFGVFKAYEALAKKRA